MFVLPPTLPGYYNRAIRQMQLHLRGYCCGPAEIEARAAAGEFQHCGIENLAAEGNLGAG
ncbi:MAG TPA: hypothetical protein VNZ61_11025 [Roseomonas sp.]|nr:hypothetical protein [Roseomonas sp.]